MTKNFINEEYLASDVIMSLEKQWCHRPRKPIFLEDFFSDEFYSSLLDCILKIPNYCRDYSLLMEDNSVSSVSKKVWLEADKRKRWNRQDVARPLSDLFQHDTLPDPRHAIVFREFFNFSVIGDELLIWLSRICGRRLSKKVSCEIVRYQQGDYIIPHTDTHDDRIVGLNFYLGPSWERGDGGELGFQNEVGETICVSPLPNSLSIIPIYPNCNHWVEAWHNPKLGRHTISMSFRPAV